MNDSNEDRVTGDSSGFWRGFAEVLEEDGIPQNQRPYYCRWVQGFIAELGNQEVNANAVEAHIKKLVGDAISGWQRTGTGSSPSAHTGGKTSCGGGGVQADP